MNFNQIITDWKFWSAFIAFLALILSQLPPIHILIRRAKLDLEVYSRIIVTHKVGNPILQVHLIIRNIGGRDIRVRKMKATILRDNKPIMQLPALSYAANPQDNQLILLTSFDSKPQTEWNHLVSFYNYVKRNQEKIYLEAENNLKNEMLRQKSEFGENHYATVLHEMIEPFNKLFDENFEWHAGEYLLDISIETSKPKADISKKYRFTIFESQTESLVEHKRGYPSGAAIY